jgi:Fe-S-cluster-containing hydrogenase component 2
MVQLLACFPELGAPLRGLETTHLIENGAHIGRADTDDLMGFLRDAGAGEATNILLLDDALCVRCNQCEAACAATHGGISRLDREAGRTYAGVHVPTTCRHCSNPLCMSDCPPDVIHRKPNGEITIDYDGCISCGNCVRNCPYGVIQMHPLRRPTLLERLFPRWAGASAAKEFPVKCDLCEGLGGIAACEASCPTGAVLRVGPAAYVRSVLQDR